MKRAASIVMTCLLAGTGARAQSVPHDASSSDQTAATETAATQTPVANDTAAAAAPRPANPSPLARASRQVSAADVQRALARYAHEPKIDAVVRVALRHISHVDTEALASRARTAGWVPSLRVGARRGQGVDLSSSVDDAVRLSTDDDLTLSASLTFDLDRVVFRREEVALARTAATERNARDERIEKVVHLYFLRRRLQLERDLGVGDRLGHAVEIARIEAMLDAFTEGAFGRMMNASRLANGQPPRAQASRRRSDR